MIEKFCENQIKAKEDTEDTWTCCAHLDSGYCFQCPFDSSMIKLHEWENCLGVKMQGLQITMPNGDRCIDFEPIPNKNLNGDGI